jgi:ubiquinone/menaquinone biosynthesis C-methylase UbiE
MDRNFRKPVGLMGHYIIRFLKKNQPEYDELDPLLNLKKDDVVLEIGFGLGQGIFDYAGKYSCTFHGVDFSRLMVDKARKLNREFIRKGKVILYCADFDKVAFQPETYHCIYFLNVIYFCEDISSRLNKIFRLLKPGGKVIIFMADAVLFKDMKPTKRKPIFFLHSVVDVVKEMGNAGFIAVETVEHSQEKNCYYILGYKKQP